MDSTTSQDISTLRRKKIASKLGFIKERDFHEGHYHKTVSVEEIDKYIVSNSITNCVICQKNLKFVGYQQNDYEMFSIDRVDISKPHSLDNIRIVCLECNVNHKGTHCGQKDHAKKVTFKQKMPVRYGAITPRYECKGCTSVVCNNGWICHNYWSLCPDTESHDASKEAFVVLTCYPNVNQGMCIDCGEYWCAECILFDKSKGKLNLSKCMKYDVNYCSVSYGVLCPRCVDEPIDEYERVDKRYIPKKEDQSWLYE